MTRSGSIGVVLLGLLSASTVASTVASSVAAQDAPAPAGPLFPAALEQKLAPGRKALSNAKFDVAVQEMTAVIRGAPGDPQTFAAASYFRGIAHARAGRNTEAIADLTQALYRKSLPHALQAKALEARGKAYIAAGLADRGAKDLAAAGVSAAQPAAEALAVAAAPATSAQVPVATPAGATDGGWTIAARPAALPPDAPAPVAAGPTTAPQPDPLTALFSGFTSPAAAPVPPPEAAAAAAPATTASAPSTDTGWGASATVAPVTAPSNTTAPNTTAGPNNAMLSLGTVPNRLQAEAMASKIRIKHRNLIGSKPLTVAKSAAGFTVTLGPYADGARAQRVCQGLSDVGFPCVIMPR